MKQIIGFALFFIGVGMIVKMFIDNVFLSVCIILGLLVLGYNLFMSCNCKKKIKNDKKTCKSCNNLLLYLLL